MENSMAKEIISGQMNPAMKDNSIKASGRVKVAGNQQKTMRIFILEHIWMIRRTVTEDMFGPMAAYTKEGLSTMLSKIDFI